MLIWCTCCRGHARDWRPDGGTDKSGGTVRTAFVCDFPALRETHFSHWGGERSEPARRRDEGKPGRCETTTSHNHHTRCGARFSRGRCGGGAPAQGKPEGPTAQNCSSQWSVVRDCEDQLRIGIKRSEDEELRSTLPAWQADCDVVVAKTSSKGNRKFTLAGYIGRGGCELGTYE